jgi:hypothetical protein
VVDSVRQSAVSDGQSAVNVDEGAVSDEQSAVSVSESAVSVSEGAVNVSESAVSDGQSAVNVSEGAVNADTAVRANPVRTLCAPPSARFPTNGVAWLGKVRVKGAGGACAQVTGFFALSLLTADGSSTWAICVYSWCTAAASDPRRKEREFS